MVLPPLPLWPVHPKPLPGEVLSSWLLRLADGNGLDQNSFKHHFPKVPGASADLDLLGDEAFLATISARSSVPLEQVAELSYARDEGSVFVLDPAGYPDWIIPRDRLGIWPEKSRVPSQPFCPACLASDVTPYYRKVWRYAFHPICPDHGLLADRCPSCGHSFSYLALGSSTWSSYGVHALKRCVACSTPFSKPQQSTFDELEQRALTIQTILMDGLVSGWMQHGKVQTPIALFLRGLHLLAVTLMTKVHGNTMCSWIATQNPELAYPGANCLGEGDLERQPSFARAWLLIFVFWLVQDWPKRWIALVRETGLSPSICLPHRRSLPAWMHNDELDQLFIRQQARAPEEVASAKKLLARLRGWPSYTSELTEFMKTGEIPPLQLRSRPVSPKVRQAIHRQNQANEVAQEIRRMHEENRQRRSRELYPAPMTENGINELLEELDDTETSLPTLKRRQRNLQGKS